MLRPVLIDTDMGVDDALAICLALASERLDLRALVSVGGNVNLDQATCNIGRLLAALQPPVMPLVGRGLDQTGEKLQDARWLFGGDGLGEAALPEPPAGFAPEDFREVYTRMIDDYAEELVVLAVGPLSNLAELWRQDRKRFARIAKIVIMGGAVFVPGNVENVAEFNFYRDPAAARDILQSGGPITLLPLDATRRVALDPSHLGHFGTAGTDYGPLLAEMMNFPMTHGRGTESGQFVVHDAVAVGSLIWPELFMHTRLAVEVDTAGQPPGRSFPAKSQDKSKLVSMILSVNEAAYLERLMQVLCHEHFHV